MLTLTRKSEYALIALAYLVRRPDAYASAREVAGGYGLPVPMVASVLKQLQRAGLVDSVRGVKGGYSLARGAETVTLLEVLEAIDGKPRLVRCAGPAAEDCELSDGCPVREPLQRVHARLMEFVGAISLRDIAGGEAGSLGELDHSLKVLAK